MRAAGRIVASREDGFTLADHTGRVEVAWHEHVPLGAFVRVNGALDGESLRASEVHVESAGNERFARADSDFSHLAGKRLANLRKRHDVLRAMRAWFDVQGLLEVDTPAIVPCPGLDVQLDAIEVLGMGGARWLH